MKFEDSLYLESTGLSFAYIRHLNNAFIGKAKLHPDDKDKASKFAGCEYAEIRATIKALKYEKSIKKANYKNLENFVKACGTYKNFDKESKTAKAVYRQLNRKKREIEKIDENIKLLQDELRKKIKLRDEMYDKLNSRTVSKKDN